MAWLGIGLDIPTLAVQSRASGTPTPTPAPAMSFAQFWGDSRPANSGTRGAGGSACNITHGMGATGSFGLMQPLMGNKWLLDSGYNHGVGGSTSEAAYQRFLSNSIASTGNPAFALTNVSFDNAYSAGSDGAYDGATALGKHDFILTGVNDPSGNGAAYYNVPFTGYQSLRSLAKLVDASLAAGRMPILCNGLPRGRKAFVMQPLTIVGNTATATETGNFVDGESYGAVGVVGRFADSPFPRPMTKVASAPGQDQYTVTSGGVYTFGGTAPTNVWASYAAANSLIATSNSERIIRDWCNSSAANFTWGGNDYTLPGAKYGRPLLRVPDTFAAMVDAATGASELAKPGTMDDLQLHTIHAGAALVSTAVIDALSPDYASSPSLDMRPTRNNWYLAKGNGLQTVFNCTLPPSMRIAVPTLVSINGAVIGSVDPSTGAITGTGIVSGTCDFATGAVTFTISAGSVMPANAQLWFEQDLGPNGERNGQMNGLMDMFQVSNPNIGTSTGTSDVTGVAATSVPFGWALTAGNLNTAIANGTAAIVVGTRTTPDGYNMFSGRVDGIHTADINTRLGQTFNSGAARITSGSRAITGFSEYLGPGASGRMYGTRGVSAVFLVGVASLAVPSSTGPVNVTQVSTGISDGFYPLGLMDDMTLGLVNGITGNGYNLHKITPRNDLTGATIGTCTITYTIITVPNIPFSFEFGIGQSQTRDRRNG